ncbi:uncharacterized protein [Cicer arietinum]|uniref:uncharacterized protein isoform X2 n=1 Tax=Cicer arietinum TaxID=3827 RepID=UPI003CC67301
MEKSDKHSIVDQILDQLYTVGYVDATDSDAPPSQKIAAALSWIISALNTNTIYDDNNTQCIEESLRLIGCPYSLRSSHIQDLDTDSLFPVIQWLTSNLKSTQQHRCFSEVCHDEDTTIENEDEPNTTSINTLSHNLDDLNHQKMNVVEKLDQLRERINKEGADSAVQKLYTLMMSLKELAARLRDVVAVRRRIDDLPCQSEIVQYVCFFYLSLIHDFHCLYTL